MTWYSFAARWIVAALKAVQSIAHADTYPSRPIRLVIPFGSGSTPAQLAKAIESDTAKWRRVVKESNYKPED